MACFLVPAAEAIVTTAIAKKYEKIEQNTTEKIEMIPISKKLSWLNNMLWGGSGLLAVEHLWHGEITPFFPFLTAMNSVADSIKMLKEMSTVGVFMAVLVTGVWAIMCACVSVKNGEKRVV